ncbi:Oidioi.mRNA.OKI2018_I69.XSR.g16781.t1.cds [Oikopleura dioica]|uniref:E3 ubiquitin protein ligase n=1 Tax=Oikopleura dioica TaxID=34765 RepID=A0ABN7SPH2_OIKDI|nr:Oidioi.mRNA.OKI2018_I69.XSR.g16781.t1.cds [Oikopleura dioica]
MNKPAPCLYINAGYVTSYGTRGQCHECKLASDRTALILESRYCAVCAPRKLPANTTAKYEPSDGKFKCPAKNCNEDQLSFEQFVIGTCCEKASNPERNRKSTTRLMWTVNRIYEKAKDEEFSANKRAETSKKKVEEAKKSLAEAEQEEKDADENLEAKKEWRKKVQKRRLFVTLDEAKEDNPELDDTILIKQSKMDDKLKCSVCFDLYDDNRPQVVLITCFHHFCEACINALQPKNCPKCRTRFTPAKVKKIFD